MCSLEATHDLNVVGNRAVAQCQPKATENQLAKHKTLVWSCYAEVAKMNTGKASGTWTHERAGPFNGCSEEEVLAAREKFMKQYMNPATRNRKRSIDAVEAAACEGRKQPRRDAAPVAQQLDATSRKPGPTSETAKAGPGRGKGRQSSAGASTLGTIPEERVLPPELPAGNWLARLSLQKQWQSSAMDALQRTVKRLEREMLAKDETIEQQARTIDELREKVKDLELLQMTAAEELASFIKLDPVLKQASHAQVLEEDPDFALVIGLGYVGAQKQSLIYKHLNKLKERLREITAGDAVKAKALSEMLYLRTHAGEKRVQSNAAKIVEHRRDIAEGIVDSIRRFVHALHDAGGNGRYPQKIRQAMQVIATAVCRAVALSKAKITIKEVGDALGLNPNLVSECKKRFDSLDDGEWEQLFDDRGTKRSDAMCEEWVEFAREFWTNPELANESHEAYNFTRRAESMSKVVRDPAQRKGGETHRIHWLEETIGLMHETMLKRGKQIFGGDFHMSWSFFLDLRPYYVKDATRETCMCVYHLRFEEMANGLLSYRRALRREGVPKLRSSQVALAVSPT
ncbi:hypothetical protein AB1Y20_007372 [Prymnesium parvum]|uniref:Uncharacterized protein n=1 Tax=Prymnesium parvum TaxID=97485 RepID=A0AB34IX05_PRYPA